MAGLGTDRCGCVPACNRQTDSLGRKAVHLVSLQRDLQLAGEARISRPVTNLADMRSYGQEERGNLKSSDDDDK